MRFTDQAVIGKITHGIIGLELYMVENHPNEYLNDFINLEEGEIKSALQGGWVNSSIVSIDQVQPKEFDDIIETVRHAQQVARNPDQSGNDQISKAISSLEAKLRLIYSRPY